MLMEKTGEPIPSQQFQSPEEELRFLRAEVAKKEQALAEQGETRPRESLISEAIVRYQAVPSAKVLHPEHGLKTAEAEAIVLNLSPERHDAKIEELVGLLQEKGLKNALSVLEGLKDPHLDDDFHRFLVQYIKAGFPVSGLTESNPLWKPLHMTLYEVSLPELSKEEAEKELKYLISGMEQFYAGMVSVGAGSRQENYFSIEIANSNGSEEFIFYVSVPDSRKALLEKQLISIFPKAKIREAGDDYNIFNEAGASAGSYLLRSEKFIFALRLYDEFDVDPLNVLLNSFSKLSREGEGAAIQLVISGEKSDSYKEKYQHALNEIQRGKPVYKAIDIPETFLGDIWQTAKEMLKDEHKEKKDQKDRPVNELAVENIKKKLGSPILSVNVRLIASAGSLARANDILHELEASFNQFENATGNNFKFLRLEGRPLKPFLRDFSYRVFDWSQMVPLNIKELTTVLHFPSASLKSSPELRRAKAGTAPAPVELPQEGIVLGINRDRNQEKQVYFGREDRLRHFYAIGQTGTGKTTLLKNMIIQDIKNGDGVCMIDPHGVDIQDVLAAVPKERYQDVIYFDPGYVARPMGLNMLEYDRSFPEQKTFVVNELFSIFQKLYGAVPESMGPMFEQYFRNATMLVIEDPDTGSTLVDVSRVMSNKPFRDLKLSRCHNPIVVQFWKEIAEKAGGEASLANIVPYITSKFDVFLANDIMRPIVAQEHSAFNFREIMDKKKILLVNLAKGRLGDINSNLIGLIIVGKILMASLSRVDSMGGGLPPFYLYIDEFQNVTTPSIATILSEARKYKLSLNIAHQFIAQLEDDIKDAVFGNVGSLSVFRVGAEDAEFLQKQLEPVFTMNDIMNLDNRNAYLKLLVNGRPIRPFNIETLAPGPVDRGHLDDLKELSYLTYGRNREQVEAEIMAKYNPPRPPAPPAPIG